MRDAFDRLADGAEGMADAAPDDADVQAGRYAAAVEALREEMAGAGYALTQLDRDRYGDAVRDYHASTAAPTAAPAAIATARTDRRDAPGRTASERRVLVVLHQEQSTPGRIGRLLRENGYRLDVRRPRFGDPLPRTMEAHAGAVVFGGPMSANDADDWLLPAAV